MKGEEAYRMLVGREPYFSISGSAHIYGSVTHPIKGSVLDRLNQQAEYIKELEWRIRALEYKNESIDKYNEEIKKVNDEIAAEEDE